MRYANAGVVSLALVLLAADASAQQFVRNLTDIPVSTGATEQVDFADVDLDGDWDAGFANGGDTGNQQNVLWINAGGAQGGTIGVFTNETAARFPAIADASRDLEFADYDADGDPDVAIANHSSFSNQPSRFWTNQGGAQAGSIGFYVDETAARWVGLGGAGSSIPPSMLVGGGFIDFPQETDFADIDSDGDLDLVQATVGGAFSGTAPTRIFLNDGGGHFVERNPSGYQLTGASFPNGAPGLWCEGTQLSNTTDSTGLQCDIAGSTVDADWADVDGDLDIDLLLCQRTELPRLFENRLTDVGAFVLFRDVTGASFQAGYASGNGRYEQCFADFDGDDDLDVYGVNWLVVTFNFTDNALRNDGTGFFGGMLSIAASGADDQTAEPIDYDLDGDLDVFVSNFSGQDRVVRNDGGWSFSSTTGVLPTDSTTTLDSDVADVDADGDFDVFDANDSSQPEWYLQNTTLVDDTTAPRIAHLEQAPARAPGPNPTVVRCHLYDNAPPQLAQWLRPTIEVRVNGGPTTSSPMRSSFAQVFRAEIDGTLQGLVEYRVAVTDEHGNAAISTWLAYVGGTTGVAFCSGDGSGTACPCGNNSTSGRGCASSLGVGAQLQGSGVASVASDSFTLAVTSVPNSPVLFFQGTTRENGGAGNVLGDGLACAGGSRVRLGTKTAAASFAQYPVGSDPSISVQGVVPAIGGVRTYQAWYRNAAAFCTGDTFNLSNGWEIAWAP